VRPVRCRRRAKTKEKEGEVVVPATDLRGDIAMSIGVLNRCKALDSESEGETSAARLLAKV